MTKMFVSSSYARNLDFMQMALGAASRRQEVLSNNIANVDTPFYKAKKVTFEAELNRVIDTNERIKQNYSPFTNTDDRHIALETERDYKSVKTRIINEFDANYRNDKNNVDIEKETSQLVKNTLHYNALTTAVTSHFNRLKSVLV